jgi:ACT domain-containing protein
LASCCVKILEVSAVAVHNFKAQATLHQCSGLECNSTVLTSMRKMAAEQRANIKCCLKLSKIAGESYEMMKSVYEINMVQDADWIM